MAKYALVNNNKVENIIVSESEEFINSIKNSYQYIGLLDDNSNVQIGYRWDGSNYTESEEQIEFRKKQEEFYNQELKAKYDSLKEKDPSTLTTLEKQFITNYEMIQPQ